jgi:hypothetical protein
MRARVRSGNGPKSGHCVSYREGRNALRRLIPVTDRVPRTPRQATGQRPSMCVRCPQAPPSMPNQSAVQRWQVANPLHEAGVVSRVPRGSRHAKACETDSNTNRTGSTHQQAKDGSGGCHKNGGGPSSPNGTADALPTAAGMRRLSRTQRPPRWTTPGVSLSGAYRREALCLGGTAHRARPPLLSSACRYPRMRWFPANSNSSAPTLRGSSIG